MKILVPKGRTVINYLLMAYISFFLHFTKINNFLDFPFDSLEVEAPREAKSSLLTENYTIYE